MTGPTRVALVTGATGFLGSRLAATLRRQGWRVIALTRDRARAVAVRVEADAILSLEDEDWRDEVADAGTSCVFHCAAWSAMSHSPGQVAEIIDANITFGTEIMESICRSPELPAFVWAATFWQYSAGNGYSPNSLYAATKQAFGDIVEYYRRMRGLPSVGLVLFDVYGEADPRGRILSRLAAACLDHARGRTPERIRLSVGEQEVDFVHVSDVVQAFVRAAEALREAGSISEPLYGVGGQDRGKFRDVLNSLLDDDEKRLVEWGAMPYRPGEAMVCPRLPVLPAWIPQVPLKDGFRGLMTHD
jgi:nucleoside-diphosphate-sugar epimerase